MGRIAKWRTLSGQTLTSASSQGQRSGSLRMLYAVHQEIDSAGCFRLHVGSQRWLWPVFPLTAPPFRSPRHTSERSAVDRRRVSELMAAWSGLLREWDAWTTEEDSAALAVIDQAVEKQVRRCPTTAVCGTKASA